MGTPGAGWGGPLEEGKDVTQPPGFFCSWRQARVGPRLPSRATQQPQQLGTGTYPTPGRPPPDEPGSQNSVKVGLPRNRCNAANRPDNALLAPRVNRGGWRSYVTPCNDRTSCPSWLRLGPKWDGRTNCTSSWSLFSHPSRSIHHPFSLLPITQPSEYSPLQPPLRTNLPSIPNLRAHPAFKL